MNPDYESRPFGEGDFAFRVSHLATVFRDVLASKDWDVPGWASGFAEAWWSPEAAAQRKLVAEHPELAGLILLAAATSFEWHDRVEHAPDTVDPNYCRHYALHEPPTGLIYQARVRCGWHTWLAHSVPMIGEENVALPSRLMPPPDGSPAGLDDLEQTLEYNLPPCRGECPPLCPSWDERRAAVT